MEPFKRQFNNKNHDFSIVLTGLDPIELRSDGVIWWKKYENKNANEICHVKVNFFHFIIKIDILFKKRDSS